MSSNPLKGVNLEVITVGVTLESYQFRLNRVTNLSYKYHNKLLLVNMKKLI